jgi:hypothetical protein
MAFDDFARRRDEERQRRERLANEIRSEWEILKGFVSQFALDRRSIEGHTFAWVPDLSGRPLLVLNFVSAMLCGGEREGAQPDYQIIFSRKPAGSGEAYPDDSPVPPNTWQLTADIVNDGFVWCVNKDGGRSSAELADAIAERLARYHVEYEEAYGRAS